MSTERLSKPLTQGILDSIAEREESYDYTFDFYDLIEAQVDKNVPTKNTPEEDTGEEML